MFERHSTPGGSLTIRRRVWLCSNMKLRSLYAVHAHFSWGEIASLFVSQSETSILIMLEH
jgi:hypothetical protein